MKFAHIAIIIAAIFVTSAGGRAQPAAQTTAFSFDFTSIDGKPMPLKEFSGRVLLVVNTASFCGYTPQYQGLETLSKKYESRGLTVIGVPSNDFGQQEPKSEAEIKSFCQGAFGVTFPMTKKTVVVGNSAHPFYKWAADVLGKQSVPSWNFHKYLVGRDGQIIAYFGSSVAPDSGELRSAIITALAKSPPAL
ncbi:MAG: glutathione peroxidase [Proteobacteria bacterium]|nr:glutathione peroxidase [Pseudomonadota bacterium]